MTSAGTIQIDVKVNSKEAIDGLKSFEKGMVAWRDQTNTHIGELAKWGSAITATAAPILALAAAVGTLAFQAAEFGKTVKDNARDLGLSTTSYQEWSHVAIAAGSSTEALTTSVRMFSTRLEDARDPASEISKQLEKLGVSVFDSQGNLRDMNDIMTDVVPAFGRLKEGSERNTAANALFGKSYKDITDLLDLTPEKLEAIKKEGKIFTPDQLESMDEGAKKVALMHEKFNNMTTEVGVQLIPVIEGLMQVFNDLKPVIDVIVSTLNFAVKGVELVVKAVKVIFAVKDFGFNSAEAKAEMADFSEFYMKSSQEMFGTKYLTEDEGNAIAWEDAKKRMGITRSGTGTGTTPKQAVPGTTTPATPESEVPAPTYNSIFESSLQEGGVGPDAAGFNNLANMSATQLAIIAKGHEGGLGTSKNEQERAQQYLSMMGGAPQTTATMAGAVAESPTSSNPAGGQLKPEDIATKTTVKLQEEYLKQAANLKSLTGKILEEYVKQEEYTTVHWTAETEKMRISITDMSENWKKYFTFAATYPTIHNVGVVVWDKDGPDWDPMENPAFMQTARIAAIAKETLTYKASDFSGVGGNKVVLKIVNEKDIKTAVTQEQSENQASNMILRSN